MAKFNYRELSRSIASNPSVEKRVNTIAQNKFDAAHEELLKEFDEDKVTVEIEGGIDSKNISGTLPGVKDGNLFSFIGFEEGTDPIGDVREVLENDVRMVSSGKRISEKYVQYKFSVRIPKQQLDEASKMPWESGNSWLEGIEKGISGFSSYIASQFESGGPSRSLGGVQTKNTIRAGDFNPVLYITKLFRNFKTNFNKRA